MCNNKKEINRDLKRKIKRNRCRKGYDEKNETQRNLKREKR